MYLYTVLHSEDGNVDDQQREGQLHAGSCDVLYHAPAGIPGQRQLVHGGTYQTVKQVSPIK